VVDFAQINEVLGLATTAVSATGKAASTVQTIKGLFEGEKEPDSGEAGELLNKLAIQLTSANVMNVELSETLVRLSQELQRQDAFEKERARYKMIQTGRNDIVYQLKEDSADGEPIHIICPVCLKRDKLVSFVTGSRGTKYCQTDSKHSFRFFKDPPARVNY
jgi:molybdopterin converting factor small subunit